MARATSCLFWFGAGGAQRAWLPSEVTMTSQPRTAAAMSASGAELVTSMAMVGTTLSAAVSMPLRGGAVRVSSLVAPHY